MKRGNKSSDEIDWNLQASGGNRFLIFIDTITQHLYYGNIDPYRYLFAVEFIEVRACVMRNYPGILMLFRRIPRNSNREAS